MEKDTKTDWAFDLGKARLIAGLLDRQEIAVKETAQAGDTVPKRGKADQKPEVLVHSSKVFPNDVRFDPPLNPEQAAVPIRVQDYEATILSSRVKILYREFSDEDQSYRSPYDVLIENSYLGRKHPADASEPLRKIEETLALSFSQFLAVYPPAKELAAENGLELPARFLEFDSLRATLEEIAERRGHLAEAAPNMQGSRQISPSPGTPEQKRDASRPFPEK